MPLNLSPHPTAAKEADKKKAVERKEEIGVLEKNSTKSSFFIYSHDRRFLIKSLSIPEALNLRAMLPKYVMHCGIQFIGLISLGILFICAITHTPLSSESPASTCLQYGCFISWRYCALT